MGGVRGEDGGPDVAGALAAGIDLLLCGPDPDAQARVEAGLALAMNGLDRAETAASARRLAELRGWIAGFGAGDVEVVGCDEHRSLADELARRSITRIRDRDSLLGRRVPADADILVIEPRPRNLTPADTTALARPGGLAAAIRQLRPAVDAVVLDGPVPDAEIAKIRDRALAADLTILGTVDALGQPWMVALARSLAATGRPLVATALRGPWDADAYPEIGTVVASYGIQSPTLAAVAAVIVDGADISGGLPVRIATAG